MLNESIVCLVIPVFNEEDSLPQLLQEINNAMDKQSRPWAALFVDDASTDKSLDYLRKVAEEQENIHYISFAENRGQSAAFAAGFEIANAKVFVTLDSDLQNNPADIPAMLDLYEQENDMVIGWRANRQDTTAKRYASKIANAIRNKLSHETVKDTGCSLKVLNAEMAKRLPMFTGMHRFLPTLMKMQGAKVAEVKVSHRPRVHGTSKYGIWDRAFSALYDLFAVRWMQKRCFTFTIKEQK